MVVFLRVVRLVLSIFLPAGVQGEDDAASPRSEGDPSLRLAARVDRRQAAADGAAALRWLPAPGPQRGPVPGRGSQAPGSTGIDAGPVRLLGRETSSLCLSAGTDSAWKLLCQLEFFSQSITAP